MKVNFFEIQDKKYIKNAKKIAKVVKKTLKIKRGTFLSVSFVDADEIHKLNLKHRNVDRKTDVLSFPLYERSQIEVGEYFGDIGDIVICFDVAQKQAQELGHSLMRELCFLTLHGYLHLLGFDHIEKVDEEEMLAMQKIILKKVKIGRDNV